MRGFWHIVEAVLACLIMFGFLIVITRNIVVVPEKALDVKAYEILQDLDEQGILRGYAVNYDYQSLDAYVPIYARSHSVQICNATYCAGDVPSAKTIWVGSYIIAGDDSYEPRVIKLYIW